MRYEISLAADAAQVASTTAAAAAFSTSCPPEYTSANARARARACNRSLLSGTAAARPTPHRPCPPSDRQRRSRPFNARRRTADSPLRRPPLARKCFRPVASSADPRPSAPTHSTDFLDAATARFFLLFSPLLFVTLPISISCRDIPSELN